MTRGERLLDLIEEGLKARAEVRRLKSVGAGECSIEEAEGHVEFAEDQLTDLLGVAVSWVTRASKCSG